MAPLRCCSFNCRGWNNGKHTLQTYINSIDLCFVQEHWLLRDHLNTVRDISPDFLSVGVSGVSSDSLCCGRDDVHTVVARFSIENLFLHALLLLTLSLIVFVVLNFVTPLVCPICWYVLTCLVTLGSHLLVII